MTSPSPLSLPSKSPATVASSSPSGASTSTSPPPAPALPPIHAAAQSGDLPGLLAFLSDLSDDAARALVCEEDDQGITALHWAAINNHILVVKELLRRGAEVDKRGGELRGTALMWAARNGHLPVVHLLLQHGADPTLLDSQSFNALHLAVHSSSPYLLAYMLFGLAPPSASSPSNATPASTGLGVQGVDVDTADAEGHTSLHWACYQGDSLSVELLLRAGASPTLADQAGLTALHWAAVKGNAGCIKRVMQAGAEPSRREGQGKTARDMAGELKSLSAYRRGLEEAGFDPEEGKRWPTGPLGERGTKLAVLFLPTAVFGLVLNTLNILPWWSGFLLAFGEFFGMHHIVAKVLLAPAGRGNGVDKHLAGERLTKSPYLCAIIVASLAWVGYAWVTRMVALPNFAITNLLFALSFLLCCYNFFRAITLEPGVVRGSSGGELKETIVELVETNSFNSTSFCLTCLTRRPLRSKHSHVTNRCVARFDHYCPWVWNDVGVNNHRQFLLFVLSLVAGVVLFDRLAIGYFSQLPSRPNPTPENPATPESTCIIPGPLCTAARADAFGLAIILWATLQLTWTLILLAAQLWQICRQMTTLEVSNVGRYGFMGGRPGTGVPMHRASIATLGEGEEGATDHQHDGECEHGHGSRRMSAASTSSGSRDASKSSFLLKILGIDRFTKGKAAEGLAHAGDVPNPFDLGMYGNCVDFWSRGRELGVAYERLYEIPDGGFRRAVRDRKRREKENKAGEVQRDGERRAKGKARAGAGYERLAMRDDSVDDRQRVAMDAV